MKKKKKRKNILDFGLHTFHIFENRKWNRGDMGCLMGQHLFLYGEKNVLCTLKFQVKKTIIMWGQLLRYLYTPTYA